MDNKTCFVSTPIYYVNDAPHIGHAYTTVLADIVARHHRLLGRRTFVLTGTDEHGQKVARAAAAAGLSPQQQADRTVERFRELWRQLDIGFDDFIRTTEPRHTQAVTAALGRLHQHGDIYRSTYEGWYCTPCERFWAADEIIGGGCPDCHWSVEKLAEPAWFFRQSAYQAWLLEHIRDNPLFIRPAPRRNETLGFLARPLADLCISRPKSRLDWGVTLPFDPTCVCYVWFDALLNYVSAVGWPNDERRFASLWPCDCHLVGKDILTTHSVYWPIILKALGLPLPRTVFAHGWWLSGGERLSKSRGNAGDSLAPLARFGGDAYRWFLAAEAAPGQDATFGAQRFEARYRADLAGGIGNLASRVLTLAYDRTGGVVPQQGVLTSQEEALRAAVASVVRQVPLLLDDLRVDRLAAGIVEAVGATNRYLQQTTPWAVGDQARLGAIVYNGLEALRTIAGLAQPIVPGKAAQLLGWLGIDSSQSYQDLGRWGVLEAGAALQGRGVLFPRR